jgi:hypothetical protein
MFSPNLFLVHARPIPAGEWGPRVATAGDLCVVLRDAIFQSNNRVRLGQARLYVHLQSCICVLCCESCRPLIAQFCDAAWCAYVCTPSIAMASELCHCGSGRQAGHCTRRTHLLFATCSSVSYFLWPFTHPCVCRAHAYVLQSFLRREMRSRRLHADCPPSIMQPLECRCTVSMCPSSCDHSL